MEENKSLYWHPTVYKYDRATETYTADTMAQTSAYYVWETGETTAFPNGFRMIGGFDVEKSFATAECVNESPCDEGDCYTENTFFPVNKCDELEVSMRMPNCWDGVSIDSPPSHTTHVAYSENSEFWTECPASHPIKLPQIQLFFRIMPYNGGWHTFSDSSSVYHADYVSGWDEEFLQNVLNNCENEGAGAMPNFFCEDFLTFRDAPKCTDEDACDFSDPNLIEKVRAFQPPPLDVKGTIVAEETDVVGELPRGTCNGSLVGDTSSEDPAPTPPPSPQLSSGCEDDASYRYRGNEEKNCEWIKENNPSLCEKRGVKNSCEKSCNTCENSTCADDPDYRHKGQKKKDCDWVKKKAKKGKNVCKGQTKRSCPVACDTCYTQS